MTNIAILGFGVVGSGVAKLIKDNYSNVSALGNDEINIKYILDLRDFPDSPFADRIVHDFSVIENDPEVSVVIEVMGGSHPAYDFTVRALKGGKSVITSNKEVVANYGDQFIRLARENSVCYKFEAAVGGGIPVIAPMIGFIGQNKIREVRGILNGTTNYILTKMFSFGESFDSALAEAQKLGYAERNPDADVLGTDAARKITILSAIVSGKLYSSDDIYTEGITKIRTEDVKAAEKAGYTVKLVGRSVFSENGSFTFVSPHFIPETMPLSSVYDVYNAVEVLAEPLGNVMFYGKGAGSGATASAVVGDLCQIMQSGGKCPMPYFEKTSSKQNIEDFVCQRYVSVPCEEKEKAISNFGNVRIINDDKEFSFITVKMNEKEAKDILKSLNPLSVIRILD